MEQKIIQLIREELTREENLSRNYRRKLERVIKYKGVRLRRRKRGNRWYYSKKDNSAWQYIGGEDNEEVLSIQKCYQLEKSVKQIEKNMKIARRFVKVFKPLDFDGLKIPPVYRSVNVLGAGSSNSASALKWKAESEERKLRYEIKYPEHLTHTTNDGTRVRSKSEVIIYNLLLELGVVFVYELPLFVNGVMLTPDFTIYDEATDGLIIMEHLGMIGNQEYMEFFEKKLLLYDKAGYVIGGNLILTTDNSRGDFNSGAIVRMLAGLFA